MTTLLLREEDGPDGRCFTVTRAAGPTTRLRRVLAAVAASALALFTEASAATVFGAVVALAAVVAALRAYRVSEESLLIKKGVGLRLCTRYSNGRQVTRFVEATAVAEIILTEAVRTDRCFFYLACVLREEYAPPSSRMVVPFRHLLPRLHQLEQIYRGARSALWPDGGERPAAAEEGAEACRSAQRARGEDERPGERPRSARRAVPTPARTNRPAASPARAANGGVRDQ